MPLNERELLVVATKVMRFSEKESLAYMKLKNHEMVASSYYRILGRVEAETRKRLYEICKTMKERHLERIEELDLIKKEMWIQYHKENVPRFKVRTLKELRELQPYISAYDESTQGILEDAIKQFAHEKNLNLPTLGT